MVDVLDRALYGLLRFNPCVTWHELRLRMRAGRAFLILLVFALLAALAVLVPLGAILSQQHLTGSSEPVGAEVGRIGIHVLTYVQITLIFLTLPAYAASTIAAERERETLGMLRATLLSPWDVVGGKLLVVVAFGGVLLATTLPIAAWCLLLGGVSPTEVYRVYLLMFATVAWVSALGVFFSAWLQRSITAIVATYGTLIGLAVVTGVSTWSIMGWLALAGHGGRPNLGTTFAAVAVGIPVALTAWLAVTLVRWVMSRLPVARLLARRRVVAVALFLVLFGLMYVRAMPLVEKLSNAGPSSLLMLNAHGAAACVLEESSTRQIVASTTVPGTTTPAEDLTGYIWSILMWLYLTGAASLWVIATLVYTRRRRE